MHLVCLDLEGVLVPEVWIAVAESTGISELTRTTRDEPDYDKLMRLVGPDTFSRVCTVKTAALDVGKWGEELERETVKDTQLQECMGEPRPRSPSVYIEKIPKNGADS